MTDDVRDALRGAHETSPVRRELFKKMGSDGMLGIGWPTEYGGQGRPPTDQFIFYDESVRANAPMPFVTLNTVGPTLMEMGSAEHKEFFLPKYFPEKSHSLSGTAKQAQELTSYRSQPEPIETVTNGSLTGKNVDERRQRGRLRMACMQNRPRSKET